MMFTEPVRLYLYSIAAAVIVLLTALGIITTELGPVIGGLVVAVLSVPATESLRAHVYAPATVARTEVQEVAAEGAATEVVVTSEDANDSLKGGNEDG